MEYWKKGLVTSIVTSCQSSMSVLHTMDQILEATFQFQEVPAHTEEGSVFDPKLWDFLGMGELRAEMVGQFSPHFNGSHLPTYSD